MNIKIHECLNIIIDLYNWQPLTSRRPRLLWTDESRKRNDSRGIFTPASTRVLANFPAGVVTLYGYGIHVAMQNGYLQVEDGIGPERRNFRLPRVNLLRAEMVKRSRGIIPNAGSLGKVRVVTGPIFPSEARLRRTQALALGKE